MNFGWNTEQTALKESARKFLENNSTTEHTLAVMQTESGFAPSTWTQICSELGWAGLTIPEEFGGFGLPYSFLVALMEEMGRFLFSAPFFSSVCLGTNALLLCDNPSPKEAYLPHLASGEKRATLAHLEPVSAPDGKSDETRAEKTSHGYVLNGSKAFVLDGHTADLLLVSARVDNTIELFAVDANSEGVTAQYTPTMDQTRKQAAIEFKNVVLSSDSRLNSSDNGARLVEQTRQLACVALAAEQVGAAERCLEKSVEYAQTRIQFGRPIGSFQAIKHKCADMMVQVEAARSAAYYAGWAASESLDDLPLAAAQAKSYCSEAFYRCAAENIQIHGGIGFTWEHEAHLYFKRAQGSKALLGTPEEHRAFIATHLGLS